MISVIVPIYNVEKFLPTCIESLLKQTCSDMEIILVDDGSPDNCGRICDDYAARNDKIRVFHQPNRGVSAARNKGLAEARGEYIGFCDPDDFCREDTYELMLNAIEGDGGIDLAVCGYNYYSEDLVPDEGRLYPAQDNEILSCRDIYRRLADMPPSIRHGVCNKLFRADKIKGLEFDEGLKSAEDGNFLLDCLRRVNRAVVVHQPLCCNVVRRGSATHGGLDIKSLRDSFRVHDRMYRDTVSRFPELWGYAIAFLLDVCTLKYNECKKRLQQKGRRPSGGEKRLLDDMRSYIRRMACHGLRSKHICWKQKVYYMLLWIRK